VFYDPGRPLKYLGSLMICLGMAILFLNRSSFCKNRTRDLPRAANRPIPAANVRRAA
jgi:hypothetical protein